MKIRSSCRQPLKWAAAVALCVVLRTAAAFAFQSLGRSVSSRSPVAAYTRSDFALYAKKKGGKKTAKGFSKAPVTPEKNADKPRTAGKGAVETQPPPTAATGMASTEQGDFLTSVKGGSTAKPEIDSNLPVEERMNKILREGYGLRTLEEQQEEMRRNEKINEQKRKVAEWKRQAERGEDFDIMAALPPSLLVFIDRFLKIGLAICTVLFVAAGGAITVEAWSKATESPLPDNIDQFIVNIVEPNFTYGLLVLLGFSVSLGAFAAAQLASSSSTYREGR